ncbi:hypothetical protein B0H10DRAFT_1948559 [Mycena sp. CBHHK59/15]|nr:hypothetical protein B0H10DRAFT_1948559 [Mycena sp. CBHHK59/15]
MDHVCSLLAECGCGSMCPPPMPQPTVHLLSSLPYDLAMGANLLVPTQPWSWFVAWICMLLGSAHMACFKAAHVTSALLCPAGTADCSGTASPPAVLWGHLTHARLSCMEDVSAGAQTEVENIPLLPTHVGHSSSQIGTPTHGGNPHYFASGRTYRLGLLAQASMCWLTCNQRGCGADAASHDWDLVLGAKLDGKCQGVDVFGKLLPFDLVPVHQLWADCIKIIHMQKPG